MKIQKRFIIGLLLVLVVIGGGFYMSSHKSNMEESVVNESAGNKDKIENERYLAKVLTVLESEGKYFVKFEVMELYYEEGMGSPSPRETGIIKTIQIEPGIEITYSNRFKEPRTTDFIEGSPLEYMTYFNSSKRDKNVSTVIETHDDKIKVLYESIAG